MKFNENIKNITLHKSLSGDTKALQYVGYMRGSRGGDRGSGAPTLKNHKNIGCLSNTGPDPLKSHKVTKPAFNVGSLLVRQRNAI